MSSYLEPVPNIPTLAPTNVYQEDEQPIRDQLDKIYTDVANVVNDKKRRDTYLQTEDITNDVWVNNTPVFTKTIAIPAINAGVNTIPHGIITISDLVDIRIVVSDGTTRKILPYASPTVANSASVDVTITDIVITAGASFGANFAGYAIIQYTKV